MARTSMPQANGRQPQKPKPRRRPWPTEKRLRRRDGSLRAQKQRQVDRRDWGNLVIALIERTGWDPPEPSDWCMSNYPIVPIYVRATGRLPQEPVVTARPDSGRYDIPWEILRDLEGRRPMIA